MNRMSKTTLVILLLAVLGLAAPVTRAQSPPVFVITQDDSTVKFFVKASVALEGSFDKWDATLTFTSPEVMTGVLDVKIQEIALTREAA
ncbi:MAG: hypothetical protein WB723_20235 [Candidatus Acidiferrales bacterium]